MKMDWEPMASQPAVNSMTGQGACCLRSELLQESDQNHSFISDFKKFMSRKSPDKLSEIHNNFRNKVPLNDKSSDIQRLQGVPVPNENLNLQETSKKNCSEEYKSNENQWPHKATRNTLSKTAKNSLNKTLLIQVQNLSSESISEVYQYRSSQNETKQSSGEEALHGSQESPTSGDKSTKETLYGAERRLEENRKTQYMESSSDFELLKRLNIKPSYVLLKRLPSASITNNKNSISECQQPTQNLLEINNKHDQQNRSLSCLNDNITNKENANKQEDNCPIVSIVKEYETADTASLTKPLQQLRQKSSLSRNRTLHRNSGRKRQKHTIIDSDNKIQQGQRSAKSLVNRLRRKLENELPVQRNGINSVVEKNIPKEHCLSRRKNISYRPPLQNNHPDNKNTTVQNTKSSVRNLSKCTINQESFLVSDGNVLEQKITNAKKYKSNTSTNKSAPRHHRTGFVNKSGRNCIMKTNKNLSRESKTSQLKQQPDLLRYNNVSSIPDNIKHAKENKNNSVHRVKTTFKSVSGLCRMEQEESVKWKKRLGRCQQVRRAKSNSIKHQQEVSVDSINKSVSECSSSQRRPQPTLISKQSDVKDVSSSIDSDITRNEQQQRHSNFAKNLEHQLDFSNRIPLQQCTEYKKKFNGQSLSQLRDISASIVTPSRKNEIQHTIDKCTAINNCTTSRLIQQNKDLLRQPLQRKSLFSYSKSDQWKQKGRPKKRTVYYQPHSLAALALQTFFESRIVNVW